MISFISPDAGWILAAQKESAKAVILKTSDGGKTWTALDGGISEIEAYYVTYMHFFDSDSSLLISKTDSTDFYRTQDGGKTWQSTEIKQEKDIKLDTIQDRTPMQFTDDRHGWMLTRYGLLKTEDGGKSWTWK